MAGDLNEIIKALRDGLDPRADQPYMRNCLAIIATHLDWLTDKLYNSDNPGYIVAEMADSTYNDILARLADDEKTVDSEEEPDSE